MLGVCEIRDRPANARKTDQQRLSHRTSFQPDQSEVLINPGFSFRTEARVSGTLIDTKDTTQTFFTRRTKPEIMVTKRGNLSTATVLCHARQYKTDQRPSRFS